MTGNSTVSISASPELRGVRPWSDIDGVFTRSGSPRRERSRQRVATLVVTIIWLLVLEGAIRKWAFPQYASALYFIRDPFTIACYWIAIDRKLFRLNYYFATLALLALLALPIIAFQWLVDGTSLLVLLYGWHNYFFYAPLAFLMGVVLVEQDIKRIMRHAMWMSLPLSALVIAQFSSPPTSPLNRNVIDGGLVFRVAGDIVRTTGTFSFTLGQSFFVGTLLAIVTADWMSRPERRAASRALLTLATVSTMIMLVLSGSRTAFGLAVAVVLAAIGSTFLAGHGRRRFRTLAVSLIPIVAGIWLLTAVFPQAYDLMLQRQDAAVAAEGSTVGRALRSYTDFLARIPDAPALGYGLGYGTGAGATLLTGEAQFTLAEDEWSRIVLEAGPLLGVAYIAMRVILAIILVRAALQSVKRQQDKRAIVLLGFTLPIVLTAQITMQASANGFCWLFVGLTLAAARIDVNAAAAVSEGAIVNASPNRDAFPAAR